MILKNEFFAWPLQCRLDVENVSLRLCVGVEIETGGVGDGSNSCLVIMMAGGVEGEALLGAELLNQGIVMHGIDGVHVADEGACIG